MQDKTVFIHCGAPKTGTSFLQVLFARYSEQLAASGIFYPENSFHAQARAGGITSGNGIELANFIDPSLPHRIENKGAFPAMMRRLLENDKVRSVLYSSEFIAFSHQGRSDRVARIIKQCGYVPRIVFFVRDYGPAALAGYSQMVKRHGETRSFNEFLRTWNPNYMSLIQAQIRAFGPDAVTVLNYERSKQNLAQVMFRDVLGMDFVPKENPRINRSLGAGELRLLRLMNERYPQAHRGQLSTFVSDTLMETAAPPSQPQLTLDDYQLLRDRFAGEIDKINGLIDGPGIMISDKMAETSAEPPLSEFDTAMITLLARLVTAVNLHRH